MSADNVTPIRPPGPPTGEPEPEKYAIRIVADELHPETVIYSVLAILGTIANTLREMPNTCPEEVGRAQQLALVGEHLLEKMTSRF